MDLGSLAWHPTVLIVLHQEHSTPGRIGLALKAMGVRLDIRWPSCGEPLPGTLADHDGVVAFGGPMGANDTLDLANPHFPTARAEPLSIGMSELCVAPPNCKWIEGASAAKLRRARSRVPRHSRSG